MQKLIPLICAAVVFSVGAKCAWALEDSEGTRASLLGLAGVQVLITCCDEKNQQAGFKARRFQTDVEKKLRKAGIKVLNSVEAGNAPGSPILFVELLAEHAERGKPAAYSTIMELEQLVVLPRNKFRTFASTWSAGMVGYGDLSAVRTGVKKHVEAFINAWQAVNTP